jgi:hypothetical protein
LTIRPSHFNLWVAPIIFLAVAGAFLTGAYQNLVHHELGDAWLLGASAVVLIAFAVWGRKAYIRVDDSAIVFGPKLLARNSYDRREVASIRMSRSPLTRSTLFLRSDGSMLCSTPGLFWGRDGLQRLADFLGVPLEW